MFNHQKHLFIVLVTALLAISGCGRRGRPVQLETGLVDRLVNVRGQDVRIEGLLGAEYYLLYFSAHWCPPCQAFTPQLVQFYNENGGGKLFHVFLVSSDKSRNAMFDYMKETAMPWQAVKFGSDTSLQLKKTYGGRGIPCLVMIDRNGKVLEHSYDGNRYLGPQHVLDNLKKKIDKRKVDPAGVMTQADENLPTPDRIENRYRIDGFGKRAGKGAAIINGTLLVEGEEIEPGVTVKKIADDHVEISYEGNSYRIDPPK